MAIEIDFLSNVTRFLRGTEDVETALESVADSLDDLARDATSSDLDSGLRDGERAAGDFESALSDAAREGGQVGDKLKSGDMDGALRDGERAAGQLESALEDAAREGEQVGDKLKSGDMDGALRDGEKAGDKLERKFRDLADAAKDTSRAGKKVGTDLEDSSKRGAEGFTDLSEEASQSARETAASFSGDPVEAIEYLQEIAANALGGFGPLGAAAGLALALGIGLGISSLEEAAEKTNEAAEAAGALAQEWATSTTEERVASLRDRWDELSTTIADSKEWWEVWQSEAVTSVERVAAAADTNAPIVTAFMEAFTSADPIERQRELADVLESLQARVGDVTSELDGHSAQVVETGGRVSDVAAAYKQLTATELEQILALEGEKSALEELRPEIEKALEEQEKANKITQAAAEAAGLTVPQYKAQREELAELTAAEEAYQGALESQAEPTAVYNALLASQEQAAREMAEATADATDDATDSWEDYYEGASVSTDQLIDEWNRQADEAAAFTENLRIIAAAGGDALANELRAKGPAVAGAVASVIATSSPEQQQAAIDAHARATGGAVSASIGGGIEGNRAAVQGAIDSVIRSLGTPVVTGRLEVDQWQAQDAVNRASRSLVPPVVTVDVVPRRFEVFK